MTRIYVLFVTLIFTASASFGQFVLQFNSSNVTSAGQNIDVDIVVADGFDDIPSLQFSLNWDPSVYSYSSIENVTNVLPMFTESNNIGTPTSAQAVVDGQLTVSWSGPGTEPVSIPDGTRLFTLRLSSVGDVCSGTSLIVSNVPRIIEVVNNDFDVLEVTTSGGELTIDDGNCSNNGGGGMDGVGLIIGDVNAPMGGKLCIPITTSDFDNIESVQLGLQWDPTVLSYDAESGVNGVGLSPINVNASRVGQGQMNVLWFIDSEPVTLADGSTLFEVCFDVIGETGESSSVSIVDFPNASPPFNIEITAGGQLLDFFTDSATFTVGSGGNNGGGDRNGVGFIIDSIYTNGASSVCVPIITENFESIVAFMSGISYDPSVLTYTGFNNVGLASNVNVADQNSANGELRVLWTDQNANAVSLADGTTLIELCFDVIGGEGSSSNIGFINIPPNFAIEAIAFPSDPTEFFIDDGVVIVGTEPVEVEPVGISLSNETYDLGEDVCVDFLVNNFTDIAGMSFEVTWNSSVLEYLEPRNLNLPGLSGGTSNFVFVSPNALRVLYTPTSPQTLADRTNIFQVCFRALQECGTGASTEVRIVTDGSFPLEIIGDNNQLIPIEPSAATISARDCDREDPVIELVTLTNPSCPGNLDGAIIVDILNLQGSITCTWTDGSGSILTNNCNLVGQGEGTYTITAVDEDNVSVSSMFTLTNPSIVDTSSVEITNCLDMDLSNGEINVNFSGGAGGYVITSSSTGTITGTTISDLPEGEVSFTVQDAEGCEYMYSYNLQECNGVIVIGDDPTDITPCNTARSIISPNGDGANENFIIGCLNDPDVAALSNDLAVYNRWGKLVYSAIDYTNEFRGLDNDGNTLDEGGYMWVLTIGSPDDRRIFRGTLTLLR